MTGPHSPGPRVREAHPRFPVLDSLRALAALGVLTTHVAFQTGNYLGHGIWGALLARLDVGVAVFFVLSGFLLSRPYLVRASDGGPRPAIGSYYRKRLLRIYPVYVVTVVVALTLLPADRGAGPGQWLRTLLLADTFTADGRLPEGLTQMWSLSVEATFYLLLPLLMVLLLPSGRGLRPQRVAGELLVVAAASCWWHLSLADRVQTVAPGTPLLWLPAFGTWFAVGIALALAQVVAERGQEIDPDVGSDSGPEMGPAMGPDMGRGVVSEMVPETPRLPGPVRALQALGAQPGVCLTAVAGLLLVVATPLGGPVQLVAATPAQGLAKHLVYALVGGLVVVVGVFPAPDALCTRALSARIPRHLGLISFSTFCIHLPVLTVVLAVTGIPLFHGHGPTVWLLTLLISLAASEVLYRLVELPGMRLAHRRGARPGGGRNSAASTATTR